MSDEFYMKLALDAAWRYQILTYPNPAVGAVVVDKNGAILSVASHKKAGFLHAEPSAILEALCKISAKFQSSFLTSYNTKFGTNYSDLSTKSYLFDPNFTYKFIEQNHNNLLKDATIYVTLEPCNHVGKTSPCSVLIKNLGFKRVVVGVLDESSAGGGAKFLKESKIEVDVGILQQECRLLLEPFLKWSSGNFSFFKLGVSLNGVISGGIITSKDSRVLVHKFRDVIELLAISGKTVRVDRPLLDARLVCGKAPDVLIISRQQNFDKSIPLFNVLDRKVKISSDISSIKSSNLTMIEGGAELLESLKASIDFIVIFVSPKFINHINLAINLEFELLCCYQIGADLCLWLKILR